MFDFTHVHDAPTGSSDPTGTKLIRDKFKYDFQKRWQTLVRLTTEAVTKNDLIGLSVQSIAHSSQTGGDLIKTFQNWFDTALHQILFPGNGQWMFHYFDKAQTLAFKHSRKDAPLAWPIVESSGTGALIRSTAVVELQGIMEAVSQQVVRTVSHGLLTKLRPAKIARLISEIVRSIGKHRSYAMVDYMIVKMFNETTLDVLEKSGVTHVGILPEYVQVRPPPVLTDAVKSPRTFSRRSEVDVLTAGDQKVCIICEKIAKNGPYKIKDAHGLIPAHAGCRCGFVPAGDLPLFEPDQIPANKRGQLNV